MSTTLKELANLYAKKQPQQVDELLEEAPILGIIPFEEASHGLWNVYEELGAVTGPAFVEMDAALGAMSVDSNLEKVDLNIMGGIIECPEDRAKMFGGKEKYFARKVPSLLKKAGMTTEIKYLYDNLRAYAVANSMATDAGGSSNTNYSILAVRWVPGTTCGLYSPEGFKKGAMLDFTPINGGSLYKSTYASTSDVLVYGIRAKGYFGMQLADTRTVGAIVNIDSSNVPTETEINGLLADVRATSKNTMLLMHEKCRSLLFSHKNAVLHMTPNEQGYDERVASWNGIPIHTSYNFYDATESNVTVS